MFAEGDTTLLIIQRAKRKFMQVLSGWLQGKGSCARLTGSMDDDGPRRSYRPQSKTGPLTHSLFFCFLSTPLVLFTKGRRILEFFSPPALALTRP